MSIFEKFIIAHIIGDYVLQNNWMALNKHDKLFPLFVHCYIYGLVFGLIYLDPFICLYVSILHLVTDRLPFKKISLTELWLRLIKGRSMKSAIIVSGKHSQIYIGFSSVVYCVVDFFFHFATTFPLIWLIEKGKIW